MNSTVSRSKPPVIERFIIRAYTFVAAIVVVALMAGGTAAQQTASGEGSPAATKQLFKAVHDNNLAAVQISIAAGADVTATNELGLMAIDVAVDRGHFEVAHFLLSIRNFRRTKQAETAPPPPLSVVPPAPAAAAPVKQPELATSPPAAVPPTAPWPANKPSPFDAATTDPSSNLPLIGPVYGPENAPPPVAAPNSAQAPPPAVETPSKSEPAQPGFFNRLTGMFRSGEEEPLETKVTRPSNAALDTSVQETEPQVETPRPATGNSFDSEDAVTDSTPPVTGAVQETADAPTVTAGETDTGAAAKDMDTAAGGADIKEHPTADPGFFTRLTGLFKGEVEKPADVAGSAPAQPAPVPPALSQPPTESPREVDIASLPRPAAVEPAVTEAQTEATSDVSPAATPSSNPSSEPTIDAVQEPIERTPSRVFFEHLSNLLKPNEAVPPAAVELTGAEATSEPDQPEASTAIAERPAIDLPPAPSEPALPNREPPTPAADTTASENNPFSRETRQQVNIPVIGEIYGPGSSLPEPEPSRLVEPAPDSTPPVEVAEAPTAPPAPVKETPTVSEESAPPPETLSLAETEKANESPGILDRLKGLFRPAAKNLEKTPPSPPTQTQSMPAPIEPPSSVQQADQSVAEKSADNAPPTTPVEPMQTAITPSESARDATDEPATPASLYQKLARFLKPANDTAATSENTAKEEAAAKKTVETARLPERPSANLPTLPPRPRHLEDVVLTLGEGVRLGKNQGKGMEQAGRRQPCLKKREGALMFCIGPVDWPDAIKDHFEVSSFMYHGTQAIVRYDEGEATSLYTLFKTESFDAVIAYYTRRFGKPTEVWDRLVKPLAAPQQPNPIMLWRSVDLATQSVSVLEVRKFDDARGGFPDLRRGTILLHREDAQPIFPRLSTLELMSVN